MKPYTLTTCDGCGAPGALPSTLPTPTGLQEHHCPSCLRWMAVQDGAQAHLTVLLGLALDAWVETWGEPFRRHARDSVRLALQDVPFDTGESLPGGERE